MRFPFARGPGGTERRQAPKLFNGHARPRRLSRGKRGHRETWVIDGRGTHSPCCGKTWFIRAMISASMHLLPSRIFHRRGRHMARCFRCDYSKLMRGAPRRRIGGCRGHGGSHPGREDAVLRLIAEGLPTRPWLASWRSALCRQDRLEPAAIYIGPGHGQARSPSQSEDGADQNVPELPIVDEALWDAANRRQGELAIEFAPTIAGMRAAHADRLKTARRSGVRRLRRGI